MALIIAIVVRRRERRAINSTKRIEEVLIAAKQEGLHRRVPHPQGLGEVCKAAWELNEFLVYVETYFKEVDTGFQRVSINDFSRQAFFEAMPGILVQSLRKVKNSITAMG